MASGYGSQMYHSSTFFSEENSGIEFNSGVSCDEQQQLGCCMMTWTAIDDTHAAVAATLQLHCPCPSKAEMILLIMTVTARS